MRRAASACLALAAFAAPAAPACDKPLYLTFDTGHMGVAPLVADTLRAQGVKVTFFLANEKTRTGGSSLDDEWAPWWNARAQEGHAFASHTWDHHVWRADLADGRMAFKPTAGPNAGKIQLLDELQKSAENKRPVPRLRALGASALPLSARCAPGRAAW